MQCTCHAVQLILPWAQVGKWFVSKAPQVDDIQWEFIGVSITRAVVMSVFVNLIVVAVRLADSSSERVPAYPTDRWVAVVGLAVLHLPCLDARSTPRD